MVNILRILHPWRPILVCTRLVFSSFLVLCLAATALAFLQPLHPHNGATRTKNDATAFAGSTLLQASKQYNNRPSDRYSSSTTMTESQVAEHVQALYSTKTTYRKTIRRTQKTLDLAERTETIGKATIPTNELLKQLNRYPALILNADYQPMSYLPLSVCHWQEAIKSVFSGKVAVVDVYEGVTIRAASLEIPLPSVIALNEYVPLCGQKPAFTRRNVFLRDEFTCQYCNHIFHMKELSIDHVVPRSMGGVLAWENAVTSCLKCNGRKGSMMVRDLKSVGMKLHSKPRAPTRHELALKAGKMLPRKVHPTWEPYLGLAGIESTETIDPETLGITAEFVYEEDQPKSRSKKTTKSSIKNNSNGKKSKTKNSVRQEEEEMQNARRR